MGQAAKQEATGSYETSDYHHDENIPWSSRYLEEKLLRRVSGGKLRILEVGCGNGLFAERLAQLGHEVIAVDLSTEGIQLAKQRGSKVRFQEASVYSDFANLGRDFDLIIAVEVIEHLFDPPAFFANAFKNLKPNGRLITTTPYHGYLKNLVLALTNSWDKHFSVDWTGGHIKFFSKKSLGQMLEKAGFRMVNFEGAGRCAYLWKSMICEAKRPAE